MVESTLPDHLNLQHIRFLPSAALVLTGSHLARNTYLCLSDSQTWTQVTGFPGSPYLHLAGSGTYPPKFVPTLRNKFLHMYTLTYCSVGMVYLQLLKHHYKPLSIIYDYTIIWILVLFWQLKLIYLTSLIFMFYLK